jgi:general secretion pathway protein L
VKENTVRNLVVFAPPRRTFGRTQIGSGSVVHYVAIDGAHVVEGDSPIALLPKALAVDLALDCSDVFAAAITAPKLSETKLRLALPNLLEDRLLTSPEDSHCAYDLPRPGTTTTIAEAPKLAVAAVDRGWLTRLLDVFGEAGLKPRSAFSEIYSVPAPAAGRLSMRIGHGRGVARTARHDGFAFEYEAGGDVPPALVLAVRQLGCTAITAYGTDIPAAAGLANALAIAVEDSGRALDLEAIDDAVNLLQGAFAPAGRFSLGPRFTRLAKSGSLRAPLLWLGTAALVAVVGLNAYWIKLDTESSGLRAKMATAFRSAFPEATAVVDPVLQTRRQMNTLRARGGIASLDDFSVLNAQAGRLFAVAPVGAVTGVEYRDGVLKLLLKPGVVDNPALQNNLRAQAVQQGLSLRFDADGSARVSPLGS